MMMLAELTLSPNETRAELSEVPELRRRLSNLRSLRPLLAASEQAGVDALLRQLTAELTQQTVSLEELRLRMSNVETLRRLTAVEGPTRLAWQAAA